MKKRNLLYMLLAAILVVVLAVMPASTHAEETEEPSHENTGNGMSVYKNVRVQEDGTYIVDLEAFATGTVEFSEKIVPVDIILVLDVSGSMSDTLDNSTYKALASAEYTYNNFTNDKYYYKFNNAYYLVEKYQSNSGSYRLRFTVNNTTYYLSGTGYTTSRPSNSDANNVIYTGVLYELEGEASSTTKIDALKEAVKGFIDVVADKNDDTREELGTATTNADLSRVAVVKLAYGKYPNDSAAYSDYAEGDHHYSSGDNGGYNYTEVFKDLTVVNSTDLNTPTTGWHDKIDSLTASGATAADYAMGYAEAIYNRHKDDYPDRQTVIVMFTDGEPNHQSGFDNSVAKDTVNTSNTLKKSKENGGAGAKVFTVAIYQGADPADDPGTTNINKYLHAVSSNYPTATATSSGGFNVTFGDRAMKEDGVTKEEYYFTATSASQLSSIFTAIAQSAASTTSKVGSQSVMKDIVSSSFTLPEGANADDIIVTVVPWDSTIHNWSTTVSYSAATWKTKCRDYLQTADPEKEEEISVNISQDGKTIDITGFDYAAHFRAASTEEDDILGANKQTAKIVVSFPIQAKPSAVTGGSVATNGPESGIYLTADSETALINFPQPEVVFKPITYVVDYVTSSTADTKISSVTLDYSSVLKNVEMLDDPSDDVLIGEDKGDFDYIIYKGKYGTISYGDDELEVQRRYVRYVPTTMNWNDYDRIFIKGESASSDEKDVWAMLAVLPANSVYYEDTYITTSTTVHYNDQIPDVTIEYTGINYSGNWGEVGAEGGNTTQRHDEHIMGWIEGLDDDTSYANDSAHKSDTPKAKATFVFSGTGLDIYSRTNGSTGTISVSVKSPKADNESGKNVSKVKVIDTKAAAGDFFAIPVCTFTDLPYGKYTASITVTAGAEAEGRTTFYLDGVRVYNPIKPLESEGNVKQIYGNHNLGAVFTEVRSLLSATTDPKAQASALYIDEHTVTEEVEDLAAIEAAEQNLAQKQKDRDDYVEAYITPAKKAVDDAEAKLDDAKRKKDAADKIYEVALDAYNAAAAAVEAASESDENYAALVAAKEKAAEDLETATTNKTEKTNQLNAAQNEYDSTIGGLKATLEEAIANKAPFDTAVEQAILDYETACAGSVDVAYTTTDVALYNREGPLSEVLLEGGESVTISVAAGKTYYIGLRSLNGDEVTAQLNSTVVKLSHTVDLYYDVTPAGSGTQIVITNNSTDDQILSVTKLRTTNAGNTTSGVTTATTEDMLAYVRSLREAPVTDYTGDVLNEDAADDETTVEEETELLEEDDIVIENEEPVEEDQTEEPDPSEWSLLLRSFFGFFRP